MSVKDRETLVFVLEKGARIPSKISTDLEPPDEWWVTKAVKSISNHALQATQPSQPTPPSPTRSPQRKKKKREIADKGTKEETEEELRLRQCMSGINEMSEKDKSSARAVLKGVTNMMNDSKPLVLLVGQRCTLVCGARCLNLNTMISRREKQL